MQSDAKVTGKATGSDASSLALSTTTVAGRQIASTSSSLPPPAPPPTPPTTGKPALTRRVSNVDMLVQNEHGVPQEVEIDDDQDSPGGQKVPGSFTGSRANRRQLRVIRRRNSELTADMLRNSAANRRREFSNLLDEHRKIVQRLEQMGSSIDVGEEEDAAGGEIKGGNRVGAGGGEIKSDGIGTGGYCSGNVKGGVGDVKDDRVGYVGELRSDNVGGAIGGKMKSVRGCDSGELKVNRHSGEGSENKSDRSGGGGNGNIKEAGGQDSYGGGGGGSAGKFKDDTGDNGRGSFTGQ